MKAGVPLLLFDDELCCFNTVYACHRQTDRQTDGQTDTARQHTALKLATQYSLFY